MSFSSINPDSMTIANLMAELSIGATVTYQEMSKAIGRNVLAVRYIVAAAKRVANEEHSVIFETVRGVGYRRVSSEEFDKVGPTARARGRRVHRAARKVIMNGRRGANDMSEEAKNRCDREVSLLNLLENVGRNSGLPEIPKEQSRVLSMSEVMTQWAKKKGIIESEGNSLS